MQFATLQEEVGALNSEVMRLRLMVHKANARAEEQASRPQPIQQAFPVTAQHGAQTSPTVYVDPQTGQGQVPLPGQPLTVLPQMFSGLEGTARLFKLLMDTYPWLVPQDMRDAQSEIALLRTQLAEERGKNERLQEAVASGAAGSKKSSKKSEKKEKKARSPSPSSSSGDDSSSSSGTSTNDSPPAKKVVAKKNQPHQQATPNPTPLRGSTPGRGGGLSSDGVLNLRRPQAKKSKLPMKRFNNQDSSEEDDDVSAKGSVQKKSPANTLRGPQTTESDFNF